MRVLIVTYYWPPAGGPGVQRWLKFVKYLPDFGIEPVVVIPENPTYPILDENLIKEVSKDAEIIKLPISEPYRLAQLFSKKKSKKMSSGILPKENPSFFEKLMLYVRGNFFIPDARIGWVKPTVSFLRNYLKKNPVDVLITTGPPHSLHLIGLSLKKTEKLKWVADFRDPWSNIHYHKSLKLSKKSEKKHIELESEVLKSADAIIVTSPSTKKEFKSKTNRPVHLITNGFDKVDFELKSAEPDSFSIAHIGSLLSERNPRVLWEVLSELVEENEKFAESLKLNFAGVVSDVVKTDLEKFDLLKFANFFGYVSHQEAIALQRKSAVLLLLEIDRPETRAILPGKLFEYLAAQRPILALGPEGSDIESILNETKAGSFQAWNEKDQIKKQVTYLFDLFVSNKLHCNSLNVSKFSRRNRTKQLSEILERLLN